MTDAAARGWGSATAPGYRQANIATIHAGGIAVPVHKALTDAFTYLLTELTKHYPLAGYADDWGYCLRCIRGTGPALTDPSCRLSNHSWGLAVDLDSSKNPMTSDLHATHEIVRAVVDPILAPFGGRLIWGGEYTSPRKDYMHFEYIGTLGQATHDNLVARRLLVPVAPSAKPVPATRPPVPKETRMLWKTAHDPAIWETLGSHCEHVDSAAFRARGLTAHDVTVVPDDHPVTKLPRQ